jgi:GTPase SAR1 family protein
MDNNDSISSGYDAYIVVYSITDKNSFEIAIDILKSIRISEVKNHPVILVGNKSDLVRKRSINREDARTLALRYTCKFVETSVAINDKVDDLLAGILKQIRLSEGIDNDNSFNDDNATVLVIDTSTHQRETDVRNNLKKSYSSQQQQQNYNVRMNKKQSKSFFQLVFRNIFKKKSSKLSILSSVENLFTAPVKISKYK